MSWQPNELCDQCGKQCDNTDFQVLSWAKFRRRLCTACYRDARAGQLRRIAPKGIVAGQHLNVLIADEVPDASQDLWGKLAQSPILPPAGRQGGKASKQAKLEEDITAALHETYLQPLERVVDRVEQVIHDNGFQPMGRDALRASIERSRPNPWSVIAARYAAGQISQEEYEKAIMHLSDQAR